MDFMTEFNPAKIMGYLVVFLIFGAIFLMVLQSFIDSGDVNPDEELGDSETTMIDIVNLLITFAKAILILFVFGGIYKYLQHTGLIPKE